MKRAYLFMLFCTVIALFVTACDTSPVVVVATPVPLDARFRTYRHPSGVFKLRAADIYKVLSVRRSRSRERS